MPRRYRRYSRRSYPVRRQKYSSESMSAVIPLNQLSNFNTIAYDLVPVVSTGGARKIKNLSLRVINVTSALLSFAVVYLPEGVAPRELTVPNLGPPIDETLQLTTVSSFYEPNQNVILSGIIEPIISGQSNPPVVTVRNRLARNLNSGDRIALLVLPLTPGADLNGSGVQFLFNYAITY